LADEQNACVLTVLLDQLGTQDNVTHASYSFVSDGRHGTRRPFPTSRGVLDMLVQRWHDSRVALRLMRELLKKQGFAPKLLGTDKPRSYAL
jgi:transposase-like protein